MSERSRPRTPLTRTGGSRPLKPNRAARHRSLRRGRRGIGFLTHPVALGGIFFLIALVPLVFLVPLQVVASVAVVMTLLGSAALGVAIGVRNGWLALGAAVVLLIGVLLVYLGVFVGV